MGETPALPDFADIERATCRISGKAVQTPLLPCPALDASTGARTFIKPEMLQRTGSFKFRGAYNKLSHCAQQALSAGVVAYSSGNHAQGVAAAAQMLQIPAAVVMPADAPAIKLENTRGYGAEVLLYDRYREDREAVAQNLIDGRGSLLVEPYDDPDIIAGQGTVGLEIARQAAAHGIGLDAVLVCCGGGGLVSGTALALSEASPRTAIYSVEPADFDDTARSLVSGRREQVDPGARSFCDALLARTPGSLTFELNRQLLSGGLAVSDAEVAQAMAFAFRRLKLVAEPGGAVALAAALSGKLDLKGKAVAIVMSGGNVDPGLFARVLKET
ncbi:MAG: threonine/serine dehydratase [Rhodospirillales bacterium]|nr:threonine/serine dehydratase [Rhodospirillales bacterium]